MPKTQPPAANKAVVPHALNAAADLAPNVDQAALDSGSFAAAAITEAAADLAKQQAEDAVVAKAACDRAQLRAAQQQAADLALAEAEAARIAAETLRVELAATTLAEEKAAAKAANVEADAAVASIAAAEMDAARAAEATVTPLGDILLSLGEGANAASRAWMDWAQARTLNRADGFTAMMQCRTAPELVSLQARLVREEVELLLTTGARVCDISVTTAGQAAAVVAAR